MPRARRLADWLRAGIVLTVLTASAALFARGVSDLALLQLLSALGGARAKAELESPPSPTPQQTAPGGPAIMARDVFELRTDAPPQPPPDPPARPELCPPDPSAACAIDLRLASVVFDVEHPDRSMVSLRGPLPDSSSVFWPGMQVQEHTLLDVFPRAVRFEHEGHKCWLRMFSANARDKIDVERKNARALAAARRRRARTPAATADYPPPRALTALELARGIRELAPQSFSIDRRLLLKAMSHWDWVAATTQLDRTPAGRRQLGGVRLNAVRSDGLLESLGLRRGDVVWTANGRAITEADALQRAIGRIDRARSHDARRRSPGPTPRLRLRLALRRTPDGTQNARAAVNQNVAPALIEVVELIRRERTLDECQRGRTGKLWSASIARSRVPSAPGARRTHGRATPTWC